MKVVVFAPSPGSDLDRRTAGFLRGIVAELREREHEVAVHEPDGDSDRVDLDSALDDADLVLVQAQNEPGLVGRIGAHRARNDSYRLLLHDTQPRALSAQAEMAPYDLPAFDGVLAGGEVIRLAYMERGWAARAWTWHEAADIRVFHPLPGIEPEADLVWIGNWDDGSRAEDLRTFLLRPARTARLHGSVYGAGYTRSARLRIALARLHYRGEIVAHRAPGIFARHRLTVHLPDSPGAEPVPGIPGSSLFEAMACGIPVVSAPWDDCEGLFRTEQDYLVARDCAEMREAMQAIVEYPELAEKLRASGLATILS